MLRVPIPLDADDEADVDFPAVEPVRFGGERLGVFWRLLGKGL